MMAYDGHIKHEEDEAMPLLERLPAALHPYVMRQMLHLDFAKFLSDMLPVVMVNLAKNKAHDALDRYVRALRVRKHDARTKKLNARECERAW